MNAIACCYAIACALENDRIRRLKIVSSPFITNLHRPPEQDDLSLIVMLYTFRARKGPARDRVTRYAAILRRYRREDVLPSQALVQLEQDGGITKAYQKCQRTPSAFRRTKESVDEAKRERSASNSEVSQGDHNDGIAESRSEKRRKPLHSIIAEELLLKVECTEEQISGVLSLSQTKLTVEITPRPKLGDKEWKLVKLLAFEAQP